MFRIHNSILYGFVLTSALLNFPTIISSFSTVLHELPLFLSICTLSHSGGWQIVNFKIFQFRLQFWNRASVYFMKKPVVELYIQFLKIIFLKKVDHLRLNKPISIVKLYTQWCLLWLHISVFMLHYILEINVWNILKMLG